MSVLRKFDLGGKVAVVTGGNRGLGEAFARALTEAGASVAIAARDRKRSEAVAEEISGSGGKAIAVDLDVRDQEQVERTFGEISDRLGPVDVLVNNAGVNYQRPAIEVPNDEWMHTFDVNVHGLWYCAQTAGRQMVENGGGSIVNIGSMSAMIVNRPQMQPAYNASKAAVHHLTKSLAAEWAPHDVRVNALAPGYHKTAMAEAAGMDRPEFQRYWLENTPMLRYSTPEELCPSLIYLASDASSFVTGTVLVVDGGYTLW